MTRRARPTGRLLTRDTRRALRAVAWTLALCLVLAALRHFAEALNTGLHPWN